jgi:hypothetical protein
MSRLQIVNEKDGVWWDALPKTRESDVRAEGCDIVAEVGNLACLCQRKDAFNNLIIQALKPDTKNAWYMIFFLRYLYEVHGIQYVRIESVPGRYDFYLMFAKSPRFGSCINACGEPREIVYLDLKKELEPIKQFLYR